MYEKLKKIRKETQTPLKILANLIGLETEVAYLRKENGERKFSVNEAIKISSYFNLPVEELFSIEELSKTD